MLNKFNLPLNINTDSILAVSYASTAGYDQAWIDSASGYVTTSRQAKVSRLKPLRSKVNSLAVELLLLDELKQLGITNPRFSYGEHGKPSLADISDVHFSISHSKEMVSCIVAKGPVGIDIEIIRNYQEKVANRFFHPDEFSHLNQVPAIQQAQLFTRYWTCKESFVKLLGDGIGKDFRSFRVEICDSSMSQISWNNHIYSCITHYIPDEYLLTYCYVN